MVLGTAEASRHLQAPAHAWRVACVETLMKHQWWQRYLMLRLLIGLEREVILAKRGVLKAHTSVDDRQWLLEVIGDFRAPQDVFDTNRALLLDRRITFKSEGGWR